MTKSSVSEYLGSVASNSNLQPAYPATERGPDPQVYGILLTHFSKSLLDTKESVRLSFLVTRTLASGFGTANYNRDKPPQKGVKKDPNDYLYNVSGNGCLLAKSYELVNKKSKGAATEKSGCVVPGMVMQLSVFKDQYPVVFGGGGRVKDLDLAEDMPMFSGVIVALGSRSRETSEKGGLFQVKQITLVKTPLLFDTRLLSDMLVAGSVEDSAARRVEFMDSDALTNSTGYGVEQAYMQSMVSQTRHVLRMWIGKNDGDIGRNADGTLYVQIHNAVSKLGVDVSRVRLHDPGNFISTAWGSGDWVENLFRFAMEQGALSVTFTYDSMREGMGSEDQIVDGFCSISLKKLFAVVGDESKLAGELSEDEETAYIPEGADSEDFAVYRLTESGSENAWAMVVNGKTSKSKGDDCYVALDSHWHPPICHPATVGSWDEGRLVRIFNNGALVSFFIVPTRYAVSGVGGGVKRKYNELSPADLAGLL